MLYLAATPHGLCTYIWSRPAAGNPPFRPHVGGLAIYDHRSRSQCSRVHCLYAHTAHTIYLQLYCCPYSTFIVAMYSLLRRSHMIYIRASNVLPILSTWYLYKIPPIPQGVGKMLATYYLLVASHASDTLPSPTHPSLLHTAYIQKHDHDVGGCCPNLFS